MHFISFDLSVSVKSPFWPIKPALIKLHNNCAHSRPQLSLLCKYYTLSENGKSAQLNSNTLLCETICISENSNSHQPVNKIRHFVLKEELFFIVNQILSCGDTGA